MTDKNDGKQSKKKQVSLVLSLPSGLEGERLKEALRKLASDNHRSLSNQTTIIIRDYLRSESRL